MRFFEQSQRIPCVAPPVRQSEPRCSAFDGSGRRRSCGGRLGIAVVLEHDEQGEFPARGDVQRLVERSFAQRSVADEYDADAVAPRELRVHRGTGRDRHHAPLNAVGEVARRLKVLAAADSLAGARRFAHHFGDERGDVAGPSEKMTVAPVIGEDVVVLAQGRCNCDADPLLPDAGVHGPV